MRGMERRTHFAKCGVVDIKRRTVSRTDFGGADGVDKEWSGNAPDERAIGERSDTEMTAAGDSSDDDEHVVDQWAKRGK